MASNERKLQTRGVDWLKIALPEIMVIAIINELPQTSGSDEERKANMIRMQLMKQMGLYPGAADLFLFKQGSSAGEMWVRALETKDKAPQSGNQIKFQSAWQKISGVYNIWRSLPELYELTISWGLKPLCQPPDMVPVTKRQLLGNMYHQMMIDMKV